MTKRQESQRSLRVDHATASQTKTWIDRELVGSEFTDVRLNKRFRKLFQQLSEGTGESIPLVCQDWASTALLNDPERCVHIGDRESDIYELFCRAEALGTHFLVRTCVDRLAGDGKHTIADEMQEVPIQGLHRIRVTDERGQQSEAMLEIRYRRIRVLPPIGPF